MRFSPGTREQVGNSHCKQAISVWATEDLLYFSSIIDGSINFLSSFTLFHGNVLTGETLLSTEFLSKCISIHFLSTNPSVLSNKFSQSVTFIKCILHIYYMCKSWKCQKPDNKIYLCKISKNIFSKLYYSRIQRRKSNSVDPDKVAHCEPLHLNRLCLQIQLFSVLVLLVIMFW